MGFRDKDAVLVEKRNDPLKNGMNVLHMGKHIGRRDETRGTVFVAQACRHLGTEIGGDGFDPPFAGDLSHISGFDSQDLVTAIMKI